MGLGSKLEAPFSLQSQQELLRRKPTDFLRSSFKGCHHFVKRQRNIFFKNTEVSLPGMWGMSGNITKQDAKAGLEQCYGLVC